MNFNNEVTEIPFVQFLLPNVHEVPKGGSAQRRSAQEKCGNQVVEIQGGEEREKKIVATKLLKMNEKKKKVIFYTSTLSLWWTPAPHL